MEATTVLKKGEPEEPIIDKSWLAQGANMATRNGKSPVDLLLSERVRNVVASQDLEASHTMIRELVERGLVPHMVATLLAEFQMAANESQLWDRWIRMAIDEGKFLRPSIMREWGEYRQKLVTAQLNLARFIFDELRASSKMKGKRSAVRSYVPAAERKNPIADRIDHGQNPLVAGMDSVIELLGRPPNPEERNHDADLSHPEHVNGSAAK